MGKRPEGGVGQESMVLFADRGQALSTERKDAGRGLEEAEIVNPGTFDRLYEEAVLEGGSGIGVADGLVEAIFEDIVESKIRTAVQVDRATGQGVIIIKVGLGEKKFDMQIPFQASPKMMETCAQELERRKQAEEEKERIKSQVWEALDRLLGKNVKEKRITGSELENVINLVNKIEPGRLRRDQFELSDVMTVERKDDRSFIIVMWDKNPETGAESIRDAINIV